MVSNSTSDGSVSNTGSEVHKLLDTKLKNCPKCGRKGCLSSRWVLNSKKKRYEPYYYFKHYDHGKVSWCYIPKGLLHEAKGHLDEVVSMEAQHPWEPSEKLMEKVEETIRWIEEQQQKGKKQNAEGTN